VPTDTEPFRQRPKPSLRQLLCFGGLFILLTALGLAAVQGALGGAALQFDPALMSPRMIGSVGALMAVYFLADGFRLHLTLKALGESVPWRDMVHLVFINIFVSNVTPLATGGGLAQVWYLARRGVSIGRAMAATTIRTALAILVIFALAPIALVFLPDFAGHPVFGRISWAMVAVGALYLAGFGLLILRTRWLVRALSCGLGLLEKGGLVSAERCLRWRTRIGKALLEFSQAFRNYLNGPMRYVVGSMVSTCVFLLSLFSLPALILVNLGHDVGYIATVGKLVVITFIMYFAPTPGAAGISEGVFASVFAAQVTAGQLVLVVVVWRFVTIYAGMLVGFVLLQLEIARLGGQRT